MKNIFPESRSLILHSVVLVILNILLLFLPLTNIFGYEFSAVNAVFLFFQAGIFTIYLFKRIADEVPLRHKVRRLLKGLSVLSVIPVAISFVNSVFSGGCSYSDGFLFYLFITIPSIAAGSSIGLLIFIILKKFRRPVFLAVFFLLFLIPLFEFYFNPQVYFFTPLLGYFPGIIYDEGLSVNEKIISYRIINLLYFSGIFLFSLIFYNKKLKYKIILAAAAVTAAGLFFYFSPHFGYSTTTGKLKSELDRRIETKHFTIHFSGKISDNYIKLISLQHEYYYSDLADFFKILPSERITSFVFYDRNEKKQLFGSENADVAKPWLYQVFTSYENYNSSLKHEIAHIFTAEFGKGPLKVADNFNPSLIEGAAMAADPVYGENTIDFMAALAFNNGYKTDMGKMYDHLNFFKQNSTLSYIYAGSFSKYLIKNYGIEKFIKLYSDLDFQKLYEKKFDEIIKDYYKFLKTIDNSYNEHAANYYFGRKSIFFKICPRHVTDRIKEGWRKFDARDYCESRDIFKQAYDLSDDYSALFGYVNSLSKLKERESAINILNSELNKFEGTSSYYNLELRLADLYAEEGDLKNADSLYLEILRQNPGRNFYYITNTRMLLARDNSSLGLYIGGSDFTKYSVLKKFYSKRNNYNLIPPLIDLSDRLDEDYRLFISQFSTYLPDNSYESSYAYYKLSGYMLENLDFINARKMAALALRYKEDKNFSDLLQMNQIKIIWLQNNYESLLSEIEPQI